MVIYSVGLWVSENNVFVEREGDSQQRLSRDRSTGLPEDKALNHN